MHPSCGSAANLNKAEDCREQEQTHVIKTDPGALCSKADGGQGLIAAVGEGQRSESKPEFIS